MQSFVLLVQPQLAGSAQVDRIFPAAQIQLVRRYSNKSILSRDTYSLIHIVSTRSLLVGKLLLFYE
jgi:hypothetical protein